MDLMKQPYTDIMKMPVYQRRNFIGKYIKKYSQSENETPITQANGKGKRTTRISGEALKTKLQSSGGVLKD